MHASKDVRSRQGKMEKSLINFHANHPDWAASAEAGHLIAGLKQFQEDSMCQQEGEGSAVPLPVQRLRTRAGIGGSIKAPWDGGVASRLSTSVMTRGPPASMSLQSLAVPLGASRYMRQENYFYWLDKVCVWRVFCRPGDFMLVCACCAVLRRSHGRYGAR